MTLLLENAGYTYQLKGRQVRVFEGCSWMFPTGSYTAICGPSGAGKTTLLNVLGLMDRPTSGRYIVDGQDTAKLDDTSSSQLRAQAFGFLFQNARLISTATVLENVALPLDILGTKPHDQVQLANAALAKVGLEERADHLPPELSGGEAQRVALARALVKRPKVLLADEPTGNLDLLNRNKILGLIKAFHDGGGTVVLVTHDLYAAEQAGATITLANGRLQNSR